MKTLAKIPILENLLPNSSNSNEESAEEKSSITLLEWISRKDTQNSLEKVAQDCCRGLEQFDLEQLSKIKSEVETVLESCNQSSMKEVKGLEERLYGLEKLMCEAKKIVEEQRDLAQAFYQNQTRASNLRDPSILPDLCASHQQQLQVMLKNHQKLRDYRRRCARAKEELAENLHQRLRWIVFVEKNLSDVDSKLLISRENIRRLKKHLEVVDQIHLAPKIYLTSVVEVVRRKSFSNVFLQWASSLANQSSHLIEKEIETRQTFSSQFVSHFLQILFPGMNDFPPLFANESPDPFDMDLPKLTISDIEFLRQKLPDLCDYLSVPSAVPMPQPSLNNNLTVSENVYKPSESDTDEYETVNEDFEQSNKARDVFTQMSTNKLDFEQIEANLKNITSELEGKSTEFLELQQNYNKLENDLNLRNNSFHSLLKLSFDSVSALKELKISIHAQYSDVLNEYLLAFDSTKQQLNEWICLKEEEFNRKDEEYHKSVEEYEKLINDLKTSEEELKSEIKSLNDLNKELNANQKSLNDEILAKTDKICELEDEICENKKQLTLEHELEITSLNEELEKISSSKQTLEESIQNKELKINDIKVNYQKLENELYIQFQEEKDSLKNAMNRDFNEREERLKNEFQTQIKQLERNNESTVNELRLRFEEEKSKSLVQLKEQLDSEHKHEMESLRHRFKLAISTTSIERTPSETSLEKVNLDLVDQLAQEREFNKLKQLLLDEKARYEELLIKSKKEKEEEIKNIKAVIQAERQVNFNEALEKLSTEKELLLQQLKSKDFYLQNSMSAIREIISGVKSQTKEVSVNQLNEALEQIESEVTTLSTNLLPNDSIICDSRQQCICNSVNVRPLPFNSFITNHSMILMLFYIILGN